MPEKSIFEKLKLKPGRSILILNPPDGYLEHAGLLPEYAQLFLEKQPAFIIQVFVRTLDDLQNCLADNVKLLQPGGNLCISYPKLASNLKGELNRDLIFDIARHQGWYPVGMISIDQDWSGFRMKRL